MPYQTCQPCQAAPRLPLAVPAAQNQPPGDDPCLDSAHRANEDIALCIQAGQSLGEGARPQLVNCCAGGGSAVVVVASSRLLGSGGLSVVDVVRLPIDKRMFLWVQVRACASWQRDARTFPREPLVKTAFSARLMHSV